MFRTLTILVAEVQTARTGMRRKLLSLTRFGYKKLKRIERAMIWVRNRLTIIATTPRAGMVISQKR